LLPERIVPGKGGPQRIALVVDASTPVPPAAIALQRAGVLVMVAEGRIDDRLMVHSRSLQLAPGLQAAVRSSEIEASVVADAIAQGEQALQVARKLVSSGAPASAPLRAAGAWRPDKTYPQMQAPPLEYRLLALVRFWNVIEHFYPYKALLDRPWEDVLREFIPRFEQAEGADAYARAVMEMSAQIHDSHVGVRGPPAVMAIRGEAGVGLRVQILEGKPVVVELLHPDGAAEGVRVGEVIEEIDGEPLLARAERLEKYAAASLPLGRRMRAIAYALSGPEGRPAMLKLSSGRTATLRRMLKYAPPSRPPFRLLEGNVGYADLTRLEKTEVDAMFERLGSTRALILDMRGYPKGTAWDIAPRINVKGATHAAWFARNELSGALNAEEEHSSFTFQQRIPTTDKPLYRGRVVMLIDEFAISQSEHSGLFFEAATNLTYVGSPTAGANGDVTFLTLPGGIEVSFTGHDVRHADGRRLQRIGLQPDVPVRPTLAGIRAGRDEVLERAMALLGEERARRARAVDR
jgi:C-terminal processing protease CtpA/Prc